MGRLLPAALVLLAVLGAPGASRAAWLSPGAGGHYARAIVLAAGNTPSGSVSNRSVTLSWTATTLPGGSPVGGYTVRRYSSGGTLQSIGSACSTTIATTTCTESATPPGTWRYSVQPLQGNWAGAESALSANVTVAGPSLAIASGDPVGTLPATVTATLAGYAPGQTLTYRLDNATTGTVLSATTAPTTIPAGGGATATITIPSGTTGGSHTIYAIGSAGDTSSAAVQVDFFATTGSWSVFDASSGTATDVSSPAAVASDGLLIPSTAFSNAFAANRYVDLDFAGPLHAGQAVSGAAFTLRFAAQAAGQTACFYFEVRQASTGTVLGTHGSSGAPVGCVTGTTQQTFTTAAAELTTSDLADDARVRVFGRSTGSAGFVVDQATLGATVGLTAVTLQAKSFNDAADTTPALTTWSLASEDAVALTSAAAWATTFATTRYIEVRFPAYVPAAATVRSVSLRHVWRPTSSGKTACWYADVYSGTTLIGTHGSSASPISCRTGAAYSVETVSLPEVDTPVKANDVRVRMYVSVTPTGGTRTTDHDLTQLTIRYGS
jgi:hypothetical protein